MKTSHSHPMAQWRPLLSAWGAPGNMPRMRVSWFVVAGLMSLMMTSSCTCNRSGLSNRYGEIAVVVPSGETEMLTRQASLSLEPVAMTDQGSGQVVLRNVGDTSLTVTRVEQREGSAALALELPEPIDLASQQQTTLAITFSPPQDDDATKTSVEHRAVFHLETSGTREGETSVTIEVIAIATGRDCLVPAVIDFGVAPLGRGDLDPALNQPVGAHPKTDGGRHRRRRPRFFLASCRRARVD